MAEEDAPVSRQCFLDVRFMTLAAARLELSSLSLASACFIYHKLNRAVYEQTELREQLEPALLSATCLYMAARARDESGVRMRDIINVVYRLVHPGDSLLSIDKTYWSIRDSLCSLEMMILRALRFEISHDDPHKYLLHYMKSLRDWLSPATWEEQPLAETAWALLRDSYHLPLCVDTRPQVLAIACLHQALHVLKIEVPLDDRSSTRWFEVLFSPVTLAEIKAISDHIGTLYVYERLFLNPEPEHLAPSAPVTGSAAVSRPFPAVDLRIYPHAAPVQGQHQQLVSQSVAAQYGAPLQGPNFIPASYQYPPYNAFLSS